MVTSSHHSLLLLMMIITLLPQYFLTGYFEAISLNVHSQIEVTFLINNKILSVYERCYIMLMTALYRFMECSWKHYAGLYHAYDGIMQGYIMLMTALCRFMPCSWPHYAGLCHAYDSIMQGYIMLMKALCRFISCLWLLYAGSCHAYESIIQVYAMHMRVYDKQFKQIVTTVVHCDSDPFSSETRHSDNNNFAVPSFKSNCDWYWITKMNWVLENDALTFHSNDSY